MSKVEALVQGQADRGSRMMMITVTVRRSPQRNKVTQSFYAKATGWHITSIATVSRHRIAQSPSTSPVDEGGEERPSLVLPPLVKEEGDKRVKRRHKPKGPRQPMSSEAMYSKTIASTQETTEGFT